MAVSQQLVQSPGPYDPAVSFAVDARDIHASGHERGDQLGIVGRVRRQGHHDAGCSTMPRRPEQ
jgi:hypothetical protein